MTDRPSSAERVVAAARAWIGTPYLHQASCRGVGADCIGLIRGVWRDLGGDEDVPLPPYTPDWGEVGGGEVLLEGARRLLRPVPGGVFAAGDILVFRMRERAVAKHVGIATRGSGGPGLIHAYSGRAVVEEPLGSAWLRRLAGVFRYPF